MPEGYVYILINPGLKKDLLKIGRTTRDPEARCAEISQGTGVPQPYHVAYSRWTIDCELAEQQIHKELDHYRANNNREFFELPLQQAIEKVWSVCDAIVSVNDLLKKAYGLMNDGEYDESLSYLEQAVERGSAEAHYRIAGLIKEERVARDKKEWIYHLQAAATHGLVDAASDLALYYADLANCSGCTAADLKKQIYWGKRAFELGEVFWVPNIVAAAYAFDHPEIGWKRDDKQAAYWFEKTARWGNSRGCFNLAWHYEHGFGVDKNIERAQELYVKARDAGYKTRNEKNLRYLCSRHKKKDLNLALLIARITKKHGFPYYINGLSIDERSKSDCDGWNCPDYGVVSVDGLGKRFCLDHYLQWLEDSEMLMVNKIISGGQTGVDRAGLDAAVRIGVETGGWCPAGRRAVDGVIPEKYDTLTETKARSYSVRTGWNVRDSDATLIINSGELEGGTELTVKYAEGQNKPYLVVQLEDAEAEQKLKDWLVKVRPAVLNVAGPREEKAPGIQKSACELLLRVFRGESDA